ncbi:putative reverse transcriptase domain-containing protein [Tanacetum coccineum]
MEAAKDIMKMDSVFFLNSMLTFKLVFNFSPKEGGTKKTLRGAEEEFDEDPEENTEAPAPIVADGALEVPPAGSTYEVGGPSSISLFPPYYPAMDVEIASNLVENRVTKLEDQDQEKTKEMKKMKKRLKTLETNYALVLSDRDEWKKAFYNLQAWVSERFGRGGLGMLTPDGMVLRISCFWGILTEFCTCIVNRIMPPRRLKKKSVKRLVEKRVAKAIEEYEKTRANPGNASGSGSTNTGGTVNVQGCTHKTFMNGKPHPFNGTEGVGDDIEAYNNCFHELALMCPELAPTEKKKVERYIKGFPERIKGNLTSSKPTTLHKAIYMARELVEQAVQAPAENRGYAGNLPKCNRCNSHHNDQCPLKCQKCQRMGHLEKDCRARPQGARVTSLQDVVCYGCSDKGHYRNRCPKGRNQPNDGARARAYVVSFVSSEFTPFINIAPTTLDTSYEVELADGKVVSTNTVLRGCTLALYNHCFKIDLLPTRLGSFDVIVGMDWLSYHRGVIVCYEKIVCIPLPNGEILEIQGERPEKNLKSLSYIKADEKKLDDIHVVHGFFEVFPDDLSGLPLVREIEFCINLILVVSPVVKNRPSPIIHPSK